MTTFRLWGVRGSTPSPGPSTQRYGGNTSCVSIEREDVVIMIDAGTGIRAAGGAYFADSRPIVQLFTHLHHDHIQGFPFFGPLYNPQKQLYLVDYPSKRGPWSPLSYFDGFHFPLTEDMVGAKTTRIDQTPADFMKSFGVDLYQHEVQHPGGAYGYKIAAHGHEIVHIPDNELGILKEDAARYASLVNFCDGVDYLCHDAQYTEQDMPMKWGWGHSIIDDVCQLAIDAKVENLILFHHDPDRSDEALDDIKDHYAPRLNACNIELHIAREGDAYVLK